MIGLNYLGKMGQLCNQMFQYAALMGIADQLDSPYTIPNHREVVHDGLGNKLRIELFDAFNLKPVNVGYVDGQPIQEHQFSFQHSFFKLKKDVDWCLIGYFQTEKYFKHIKDKVKEQFQFHQHIIDDCQSILELFDNPVALHIRRGDYLINGGNHHSLSMVYYEKALLEFPDRQVVIFSDDPEWCLEHSLFDDDRFVVSEGNGPYHDLYMMSQCKDFIISNSTYAWWGAWLADTGSVIAPNKWFGPNNEHKSLEDLYPEHWKMIPYS